MDWFNDLFIEEAKAALGRPEGSSTGGVSSWNDLTDKPFYDNRIRISIKLSENSTVFGAMYQITDATFTEDEMMRGSIEVTASGMSMTYTFEKKDGTPEDVDGYALAYNGMTAGGPMVMVVKKPVFVDWGESGETINIPVGTYIPVEIASSFSDEGGILFCIGGDESLVKLDSKFVPERNVIFEFDTDEDATTASNGKVITSASLGAMGTFLSNANAYAIGYRTQYNIRYAAFRFKLESTGISTLSGSMVWNFTHTRKNGDVVNLAVSLPNNSEDMSTATWSLTTRNAPADVGVPTVTADDNGKFLRVVNGAWAASSLENAEGGSF